MRISGLRAGILDRYSFTIVMARGPSVLLMPMSTLKEPARRLKSAVRATQRPPTVFRKAFECQYRHPRPMVDLNIPSEPSGLQDRGHLEERPLLLRRRYHLSRHHDEVHVPAHCEFSAFSEKIRQLSSPGGEAQACCRTPKHFQLPVRKTAQKSLLYGLEQLLPRGALLSSRLHISHIRNYLLVQPADAFMGISNGETVLCTFDLGSYACFVAWTQATE